MDRSWFIPVKLSECQIPDRSIGAGETLLDLQYVELFCDWDDGVSRIVAVIQPGEVQAPTSPPADAAEDLSAQPIALIDSTTYDADRSAQSDQAPSCTPADNPPRADVSAKIGEADTPRELPERLSAVSEEHRTIAPQAEVSEPSERPTLPLAPDGVLSVVHDALARIDEFLSEKRSLFDRFFSGKVDDEVLRQTLLTLRVAETALYDSTISNDVREKAIKEAKASLPRYAELDTRRDSKFGPLQGCLIRAIANAGLAKIYEARGNQALSYRHLLLAFVSEPRIARDKFFPEFYEGVLRSKCQERVDEWYRQAVSDLGKIDYRANMPPANAIGIVDRMYGPTRDWKEQEIRRIMNTTPDSLKKDDINRIKAGISGQIDNNCREVARELLDAL